MKRLSKSLSKIARRSLQDPPKENRRSSCFDAERGKAAGDAAPNVSLKIFRNKPSSGPAVSGQKRPDFKVLDLKVLSQNF